MANHELSPGGGSERLIIFDGTGRLGEIIPNSKNEMNAHEQSKSIAKAINPTSGTATDQHRVTHSTHSEVPVASQNNSSRYSDHGVHQNSLSMNGSPPRGVPTPPERAEFKYQPRNSNAGCPPCHAHPYTSKIKQSISSSSSKGIRGEPPHYSSMQDEPNVPCFASYIEAFKHHSEAFLAGSGGAQ